MTEREKILYLQRYRDCKHRFDTAKRNLEELETYLYNISPHLNLAKVQTSPSYDKLANTLDRWTELHNDCLRTQEKSLAVMKEVIDAINTVKHPVYHMILTRQFIQGRHITDIAREIHFDYSYVYKLRKKALAEMKI